MLLSTAGVVGCDQPNVAVSNVPVGSQAIATPALATGPNCTAGFNEPKAGLIIVSKRVVEGGEPSSVQQIKVTASEAGIVTAERRRLVGPDRRPSQAETLIRIGAFVPVSTGAPNPIRQATYGPELSLAALKVLRPGEGLKTTVTESSNFVGLGAQAQGKATGPFEVHFVGCAKLAVAGRDEPVKVFDVVSVSRSFDDRAAGGPKDTTVTNRNRYWVSERVGWVLRNDTPSGSILAESIEHPG